MLPNANMMDARRAPIDCYLSGFEELFEQGQVRRMLEYLGLPFEEACLTFHKTDRAVRTASSEQVRRPINRSGQNAWKPFEPWLGDLRSALGPLAG